MAAACCEDDSREGSILALYSFYGVLLGIVDHILKLGTKLTWNTSIVTECAELHKHTPLLSIYLRGIHLYCELHVSACITSFHSTSIDS